MTDQLIIAGHAFDSRFILGSGKYSYDLIKAAVDHAGAEMITMALKRNEAHESDILEYIPDGVTLLPNTSGATNAEEAIRIARLARALSGSDWVKIEIMPDRQFLMPDGEETLKATRVLAAEGFIVLPYMMPDLVLAHKLVAAGAAAVMPLASTLGSNRGLANKDMIQLLVDNIDVPVIIDAGIGKPSQAAEAMEMGVDAIMANTAIATADNIPLMAAAFHDGISAGRKAYLAKAGRVLDAHTGAVPSSPMSGQKLFSDLEKGNAG